MWQADCLQMPYIWNCHPSHCPAAFTPCGRHHTSEVGWIIRKYSVEITFRGDEWHSCPQTIKCLYFVHHLGHLAPLKTLWNGCGHPHFYIYLVFYVCMTWFQWFSDYYWHEYHITGVITRSHTTFAKLKGKQTEWCDTTLTTVEHNSHVCHPTMNPLHHCSPPPELNHYSHLDRTWQ
jgi:hypothetical protein